MCIRDSGYISPKWAGKCTGCGEWNTMQEEIQTQDKNAAKRAVSYTHLDVYKRQTPRWSHMSSSSRRLWEVKITVVSPSATPVSYTHLDVYKRQNTMHEICNNGGAIFFSTHVLDVAEKLCNKVAIIKDGKLVVDGKIYQITSRKDLESVFMEVIGHDEK